MSVTSVQNPVSEFFAELVREALLELGHPPEDYTIILSGLEQNRGLLRSKLVGFLTNLAPKHSESSEEDLAGYGDHLPHN